MGVAILMSSAGFTPCSTRAGVKGFQRDMKLGRATSLAVFPLNAQEIASPYDPVRCCRYDAEGEMVSEETLASLFDLLERHGLDAPAASLRKVGAVDTDPQEAPSS